MNNHIFAVSMNTKITDNVAKHRVLQTMAFTLKEYNYKELRKVYEAYKMHVTPIESNARIWLEQQVVKGEKPYRYSNNKISIKKAVIFLSIFPLAIMMWTVDCKFR